MESKLLITMILGVALVLTTAETVYTQSTFAANATGGNGTGSNMTAAGNTTGGAHNSSIPTAKPAGLSAGGGGSDVRRSPGGGGSGQDGSIFNHHGRGLG